MIKIMIVSKKNNNNYNTYPSFSLQSTCCDNFSVVIDLLLQGKKKLNNKIMKKKKRKKLKKVVLCNVVIKITKKYKANVVLSKSSYTYRISDRFQGWGWILVQAFLND